MATLGLSEHLRYSDLPDEVQVKDSISLDLMCGITIPLKKLDNLFLSTKKNTQKIVTHLGQIRRLLAFYDHLVPIYDIDSMTELTNQSTVTELIKTYKKKI